MATIKNLTLSVELTGQLGSDVKVHAEYDIFFSALDRLANVVYHETCQLIGDDTGVGDVGNGGDDILLPPSKLLDTITATDGRESVHRTLTKTISRDLANEDPSRLQPKDELRVEVRLEDEQDQVQPQFAESNLVEGKF
jgi:hypothetical protein